MALSEYTDVFKSVKIVHDVMNRIDFAYLAEFFRFLGIFVCEDILVEQAEDKTEIEENTVQSVCICAGTGEMGERKAAFLKEKLTDGLYELIEPLYKERVAALPENTIFLYDDEKINILSHLKQDEESGRAGRLHCLDMESQKAVLGKLMECISDQLHQGQAEKLELKNLKDLIEIFVEEELWFHSLNLQYYAKQKSHAAAAAKEAFLRAHGKVQDSRKRRESGDLKDGIQYMYDYASLWCETKTNAACDYCHGIIYFLRERIEERCEALCRKYPDFSNAKVLLGLCYTPFRDSDNEAIRAFNAALQGIRKECFASSVYYWIGKCFETYPNHHEETKKVYLLANGCRRKFRTTFKLAVLARDEANYEEAIKLFREIIDKLHIKESLSLVDPLEVEYLFKVYTQLAYIYFKQKDYDNAIEAGQCVIKIAEKYVEPRGCGNAAEDFFDFFYNNTAAQGQEECVSEAYRSITRNRLDVGTAYKIIAESYAGLMEPDKAKEYRNRIPKRG